MSEAQHVHDDELLMNLGYKPELKRNFSPIQVFGIAFSIMSLVPSIASVLADSLSAGGVGMTWGWFVPSFFIMLVGISLSEMGSSMPTSGGLYWWTYKFAHEKLKRPLCFLCGYANTLGLIGGICSIDYGFAAMVMSIPAMATDGDFVPTKFETYGVFVGCVLLQVCVASVATSIMSKLQTFCIVLNMILIFIVCIALPIGASNKGQLNSGKFVFTDTTNLSDWTYGWSWVLSWMSAIWTIGAFDSCIHMSEEASNAATAVPLGIIMSIGMCWILGFAVMAILAAVVSKDFGSIIDSFTGQPMAQIIYDCLGKKWAIAIMCIAFVVQWFMGLSILVAASRQTWAFSRDGALPLSSWIRKINYKTSVPVYAVIFDAICAMAIGCLTMIGSSASLAVFSLAACSNGLAWMLPIICRAIWFRPSDFIPGPFYTGHFLSRIINIVAATYLFFVVFIITLFPADRAVEPDTMNYTVVINFAVWLGALLYYFVHARKWFQGPKLTLDLEEHEGVAPPIDKTVVQLPPKPESVTGSDDSQPTDIKVQ